MAASANRAVKVRTLTCSSVNGVASARNGSQSALTDDPDDVLKEKSGQQAGPTYAPGTRAELDSPAAPIFIVPEVALRVIPVPRCRVAAVAAATARLRIERSRIPRGRLGEGDLPRLVPERDRFAVRVVVRRLESVSRREEGSEERDKEEESDPHEGPGRRGREHGRRRRVTPPGLYRALVVRKWLATVQHHFPAVDIGRSR